MPDLGVMASLQSASVAVGNNTPVLQLCSVGGTIAAGLSNGSISLVQQTQDGLQQVGMLKSHTAAVRGLVSHDKQLYSASEDGSAHAWDLRSMQEAQRFTHGGKAGLSAINATDNLLVGGADDGTLLFWDRRTGNLRASFHDTHPEAVTQVCFPEHRAGGAEWLISSSADGFINVMDLKEGLDEEEAFRAALNSTPSVASCGLYGLQDSKLWALSQIESLHLWEWAAAIDEEVPGGEGTFCDDEDVRKSLAASQEGLAGQPEPHSLVSMSSAEGGLRLASTSETGDVAIFRVDEPDAPGSMPTYTPELALKGAHSDVVRAILWPSAHAAHYVTASDDAIVSVWHGAAAKQQEGSEVARSKKRQRRT
ncbi:g834 [Coccomyxa viridis]|uniref:G834 protein n=1 Tax=Coccomyxa viridis TaxID=1274662 RepID=A0ABP1FIA8_9CHLO